MRLFMLMPLFVWLYEVASLIRPLKISAWSKFIFALILMVGISREFLYRRTARGFDVYELPYPALLAMSLIFNFLVITFFILLMKDACFIVWKIFSRAPFPGHCASLFVFSVSLCATLYGTYEGLRVPGVNSHEVVIENLGKEFDGLKVAMLVDIHADALTNREAVQKIVNKTNSLGPDLILMPGDFVDGQVISRFKDLEPLKDLKAPLGVFGSTGNHEYYYDLKGWLNTLENDFGVKMLENEHVILKSGDAELIIAGVPDMTGGQMGISAAPDIEQALKDIPEGSPVILMDHRPNGAPRNAKYNVALQISGHTHGGQIPGIFQIAKKMNGGFVRGWYQVENMKLYVSPGTSQWNGFPVRIFDPSEITLFILRSPE